jgi:hypothetical protein
MPFIEKYYLDNLNSDSTLRVSDSNPQGGGVGAPRKPVLIDGNTDDKPVVNSVNKSDDVIISIVTETTEGKGGATILVDGVPLEGQAPKEYSIKKSELFTVGKKVITVNKTGYSTNQRYEFSVTPYGDTRLDDVTLLQDEFDKSNILGVENLKLDIKYFEGDEERPYRKISGNFIPINFILKKDSIKTDSSKVNLEVLLSGPDLSVLLTSNGESEFLEKGSELYTDKLGTKYFIKSANTKLYRISKIIVTDKNNKSETLVAGNDESLSTEIVLNRDLKVEILSHRLVKVSTRRPMIKLKSNPAQTYNINEKNDIPLVIEKNDAVRAISVIIGNEIIEFDNLKKGKYVGINLPHSMVEKLGQYQIKIFPYSISELQEGKKDTNVEKYEDLPDVTLSDRPRPQETKVVETKPTQNIVSTPISQNTRITPPQGSGRGSSGGSTNYKQNML